MARGWESKAVEDQVQNQVQNSQTKGRDKRGQPQSPAQYEARRQREVLLLSRTRVQKSLESSQDPRYREQLNRALADIESQIAALENKAG
jgi:hypothetical protein